jgi:hypothetical protein
MAVDTMEPKKLLNLAYHSRSPMKLVLITCLVLFIATPVVAAPQWVEDACWRQANRVLPRLDAREREAYIANCIADWTAGSPPKRHRRY